ncbi:MAG: hypothetical protein ACI89D_000289 [Bermanella sp.]
MGLCPLIKHVYQRHWLTQPKWQSDDQRFTKLLNKPVNDGLTIVVPPRLRCRHWMESLFPMNCDSNAAVFASVGALSTIAPRLKAKVIRLKFYKTSIIEAGAVERCPPG